MEGKVIKDFRIKQGLTQKELAEMVGVSWVTISRYENNHHKIHPVIEEKIKQIVGEK